MDDADLVAFLQWALPRLHLRWPGYRKVRGTVRRRLNRRLRALELPDLAAYRRHLDGHSGEWAVLGAICRVAITRFYRDRAVFDHLRRVVLPELARLVEGRGAAELRCWSAGCASGEEPYTLKILWELGLPPGLARTREGDRFRVRDDLRDGIEFLGEDLTERTPAGPFHLILCRNLAFTYFDEPRRREVLGRLAGRLVDGGYLVVGAHETLPERRPDLVRCPDQPCFHRKILGDPAAGPTGLEREMLLRAAWSRSTPSAIRGGPEGREEGR